MTMTNPFSSLRDTLSQKASEAQRRAANPRLSVWVGASAGTGKTKVLSDRVLRLLLDGVDAGKILCLTYTKAAAVEMNSRVAKRLSQWAVSDEEKLENELSLLFGGLPQNPKFLQELKARARCLFAVLLDTPGGIKIQTIHSFCQEILRRFPLESGVSPYFEIMDDRNVKEAIGEIQKRLSEAVILDPENELSQAMLCLTNCFSDKKFPDIIDNIINNRGKINRLLQKFHNDQNELLSALANKLQVDIKQSEAELIAEFWRQLPREELRILLQAWLKSGKTFNNKSQLLAEVLEGKLPNDAADYVKMFIDSKGEPANPASKAILTANPELRTIVNREYTRGNEFLQRLAARKVYETTAAVIILAQKLINGYNNYKITHAKTDYSDLILLTRNLLENKEAARWVLYKLDGGIEHILIDEAQDTSPDQWAIIQSVSDEFFAGEGADEHPRTIFAVGDRKQSIYSFQGADPDKFDAMREYFSGKAAAAFAKIDLEVSFRSVPAILDVVNSIFSNENIASGVTSIGEKVLHIPFRQGEAGKVEFWDLIEPLEGENKKEWLPPIEQQEAPSTSRRMARMIVQKIKQAVSQKEILLSKNRPLRYSDFLILVRKRDVFCEELIRECKLAGVAVAGMDRIKLLEQIAVQDLISLGKFLLLPEDDLSLAEVLKSPLFGLNDDDLFTLCYERRLSLWHSLCKNPAYAETAETLRQLLNLADYARPFELYGFILTELRGKQKYAMRMGLEAEDGLEEFVNLTLSFEQSHTPSLQNFIDWVISDDVEIKREFEQSDSDVVRLMTVHGSKGLQAPIVILPDTTKVPQSKREAGMLWDDDMFLYPAGSAEYDDVCNRVKDKKRDKMLEEYRRLLYVALTRAEDRMIICGYRKKREPAATSWYKLLQGDIGKIAVYDEQAKKYEHNSQQLITPPQPKTSDDSAGNVTLPLWATRDAEAEKPLGKPLTPSKPDEDTTAALSPLAADMSAKLYLRGTIIHKLLQYLPHFSENAIDAMAEQFILSQTTELDTKARKQIISEVKNLLSNQQFGAVFGPFSKAEVPIMGRVDGQIISGQIDRLIVEENRVLVVDFKTNRPSAASSADIPDVYRKQMRAYRQLLQKIYPQKEIITLILWTNTATLMVAE